MVVWGFCGKSLFDELEKIHVRAAKTIYNLDWKTPSEQVLAQSNWFTINWLYECRLLSLAHDCFYVSSPVPIKQLFTIYDCNYNLRRKMTFLVPKPNSELLRKSTCYKAISPWNSLENHTRSFASKRSFKNTLKRRISCK